MNCLQSVYLKVIFIIILSFTLRPSKLIIFFTITLTKHIITFFIFFKPAVCPIHLTFNFVYLIMYDLKSKCEGPQYECYSNRVLFYSRFTSYIISMSLFANTISLCPSLEIIYQNHIHIDRTVTMQFYTYILIFTCFLFLF